MMKREVVFSALLTVAALMLSYPASSYAATAHTAKMQASANSSAAAKGYREAMQMVPAQAVLTHRIDARKLQPGDKFQAALAGTVDLKNGLKLPRGTELIGTIVRNKMEAASASTLALRFTQARMKDGKIVPIKATIVGLSAPASAYTLGSEPSYPGAFDWNDKTLQIDQLNVVSGVSMHSAITSKNSALLVAAKKHDVKIPDGEQIALAIAARQSGHQHKMASGDSAVSSGS